jgi:hypothetical protein
VEGTDAAGPQNGETKGNPSPYFADLLVHAMGEIFDFLPLKKNVG